VLACMIEERYLAHLPDLVLGMGCNAEDEGQYIPLDLLIHIIVIRKEVYGGSSWPANEGVRFLTELRAVPSAFVRVQSVRSCMVVLKTFVPLFSWLRFLKYSAIAGVRSHFAEIFPCLIRN